MIYCNLIETSRFFYKVSLNLEKNEMGRELFSVRICVLAFVYAKPGSAPTNVRTTSIRLKYNNFNVESQIICLVIPTMKHNMAFPFDAKGEVLSWGYDIWGQAYYILFGNKNTAEGVVFEYVCVMQIGVYNIHVGEIQEGAETFSALPSSIYLESWNELPIPHIHSAIQHTWHIVSQVSLLLKQISKNRNERSFHFWFDYKLFVWLKDRY